MIVERQYNWRGFHSRYRLENSWTPLDAGNTDFQKIKLAIEHGICAQVEPVGGQIQKAYDRPGHFSGYLTRFGFVPVSTDNHLLTLISDQLSDGRSTFGEPLATQFEAVAKLEKLLVCVVLEQRWPHLSSAFSGELAYASHERSAKRSYRFIMRNLPTTAVDKVQLMLSAHDIDSNHPISCSALQFGVLEIDLPIEGLKHLFMGEKAVAPSWMAPTLIDQLEQHYNQTRRKPSEGPDIAWLIGHVGQYVGHFAVEFTNHVIEAFKREYGYLEWPLQNVTEGNRGSNPVVLGCTKDGDYRLISLALIPGQNHALSGEWHQGSLRRYQEETLSPSFLYTTALSRVSEMVKLGYRPEPLAPLNAFLEVSIRWALANCDAHDAEHLKTVADLGHRRRLAVLKLIANSGLDSHLFDGNFRERISGAEVIYKNRNLFVHSLRLVNNIGRVSLLQRRQLEALFRGFLDYFEQNQFLMRLQHIAQDTGDVRGIVVGALQEFVKGRRDRIQQMVAALSEFRTLQIRATRFDPSPYE